MGDHVRPEFVVDSLVPSLAKEMKVYITQRRGKRPWRWRGAFSGGVAFLGRGFTRWLAFAGGFLCHTVDVMQTVSLRSHCPNISGRFSPRSGRMKSPALQCWEIFEVRR